MFAPYDFFGQVVPIDVAGCYWMLLDVIGVVCLLIAFGHSNESSFG